MNESMVESANAKLQQRDERRRFQAARLQRAHNRVLRRHAKTSVDLTNLKKLVEKMSEFHAPLRNVYAAWCQLAGVPTPQECADRKRHARHGVAS